MALPILQRLARVPRPLPPPAAATLIAGASVFPSIFGGGGGDDSSAVPHSQPPSMELMAVPRKKVSRHKRGLRNGPKALKPIPVIIRCKSCGRVKLPHFYCCSGERGNNSSPSS